MFIDNRYLINCHFLKIYFCLGYLQLYKMDKKDSFSEYHSLWIIFKNKQDQEIHEVEFIIYLKTYIYNQNL